MKCTRNLRKTIDDNLVVRWVDPRTNQLYSQRKRLPASASTEAKIIQTLYLDSAINVIKFLRIYSGLSIKEGMAILDKHRYYH